MNKTCGNSGTCDRSSASSLGTLLLITLIPKCPLCLLSYSTAISLCGGKTIFQDGVGWTSYIPVALSVVLIFTFIYNYKGYKTLVSIALAVLGSLVILYGEYFIKTQAIYYLGTFVLFFSCWVNGSFSFMYRYFFNHKTVLR